ncbi:hypothetical protein E1189_01305 [Sansalvadorimonas verongulae]|nr:hypothetical protein [Sansalvadorimonas verongulae]
MRQLIRVNPLLIVLIREQLFTGHFHKITDGRMLAGAMGKYAVDRSAPVPGFQCIGTLMGLCLKRGDNQVIQSPIGERG